MVYLSKIYTRTGDDGSTMLADGSRTAKHSLRVAAYGDVDELNALLGVVRVEIERTDDGVPAAFRTKADGELGRIQQELFDLGAELATPEDTQGRRTKAGIPAAAADRLESWIDAWNAPLPPLRSFVLPGGGPVGAYVHLARTVCRRAERTVAALCAETTVRPEPLRYLNRLSDYLFVLARAAAHASGRSEVLWTPTERD
ncbi:MAG: cob(I)yrinic acid a,c-diamide adenosyltransferase [Deltaproteobacteria bacterium]|nr:MAG: cob(I)yrinic acid a,c-diamide adenosyltransferase [Deltaproteobacteria bacterium]